jgi:DNA polymerase-1
MSARPLLYLIDGSSQMYRAFHAPVYTGEGTTLRNAAGQPTNAVYIFVTMLRKLLKEHAPAYIAASFDLPGRTFRDDLAEDYKANRAPMPDDLAVQIPLVHRACEALGVPIVTHERYEADDVIGTLAVAAVAGGYDVVIVTGDKDFFQLVGPGVRVFNPRDEGAWYDAAGVKEKFGVEPSQVVDTLALMGDTIDNVKGVPGVGEKGARELITTFGTLDALLERAAEVTQKRYREALLAHADLARSSRELLRIHTDVPIPFEPEALKYRGPSSEACYTLFSELGFGSLTREFAPTAATTKSDYALVTSVDALRAVAAAVRVAGRCGIRVLADGPAPVRARIIGIAVAMGPRAARYVPVTIRLEPDPASGVTTYGATSAGLFDSADALAEGRAESLASAGPSVSPGGLALEEALNILGPLFEDPAIEKAGHDLKADVILLARHGVTLRGLGLDTMIASYLLDATRQSHSLEGGALEQLGYRALTDEDLRGRGAKARPLAAMPPEAVLTFAAERADLALQLAGRLAPSLAGEGLDGVYRELEQPLIPILAAMERAGVRVDGAALASLSGRVERDLAALESRIHALAGGPFNINSPKQLSEILFDRLQLPASRKSAKTRAASTAVDVLDELAEAHELPRLILEWRALQKLKGTYIDALPALVNPETGRVHTSFNQAVAATGRLSSSDPNLQNIPIRTELGREIRRAFAAEPGHVLVSADYSQIELRVLAHLSGDETLTAAFRNGEDIHDQTALKVFGPASGLDPHELRRRAKIINYALLYGKTAFTLAKDIGVTQEAAQHFIDAYFSGFPRVRTYIDSLLDQGRRSGVVKTLYGRQRRVPDLTSRNGQLRMQAERQAVNHPIQGTAADIMKRAMIDLDAALAAQPGARMILTVHDELLLEVPERDAEPVADLARRTMASAVTLNVPLVVDVGIGKNWKEAKG